MNINNEIIGQALSMVGLFFTSFGYIQKDEKKLKRLMTFSGIFWISSFYLLGSYTAFYISCLNTFRQFLTWVLHDHNEKNKLRMAILFTILNILISFFTWQGIISIFPALASIIATISTFSLKDTKMRIGLFCYETCWLINSSYFVNIGGIICCLINMPILLKQIFMKK